MPAGHICVLLLSNFSVSLSASFIMRVIYKIPSTLKFCFSPAVFSTKLHFEGRNLHVLSCATSGSAFSCSLGLAFESACKSLQCIPTSITAELSLGQGWIHLGAGWHWLHQPQEKLLAASPKSRLCCVPCFQTLPQNPIYPLFLFSISIMCLFWIPVVHINLRK